MTVLLATSAGLPAGEPGAPVLDEALRAAGIDFAWAVWDDPAVDWAAADLVAVRSPWDYAVKAEAFMAWARSLDQSRLLNGADIFAWNADKRYLAELDGLMTVPTRLAQTPDEFAAAMAEFGRSVVKPRTSAGGAGLIVVESPDDPRLGMPIKSHVDYPEVGGPWIVQPVVESIFTRGEVSVYVLDGQVVSQFDKTPGGGDDVRVNEEFGGTVTSVDVEPGTRAVAEQASDWVAARFGRAADYLRVDLLEYDGAWVVSELELIEPGLYLDMSPVNAAPFADLVVASLA